MFVKTIINELFQFEDVLMAEVFHTFGENVGRYLPCELYTYRL